MIRLPIDQAQRIAELDIKVPRGVLLYGPSGSGKTRLALQCARLSSLNVFCVQGTQIRSKYVGESEKNLVSLFRRARACAPCILLLDQLDGLFAARAGADDLGSGLNDRLVACMLNELDGLSGPLRGGDDGIFVLATALTPASIDPALLRPGRIGRHFEMPRLGDNLRRQFIQRRCAGMPLQMTESQIESLVQATAGYSGAQMDGLFREAAMKTLSTNLDAVVIPSETVMALVGARGRPPPDAKH